MCGIVGCFGLENAKDFIQQGLQIQKNRGQDGFGASNSQITNVSHTLEELQIPAGKNLIAHSLHSIVSHVKQPVQKKGVLVANCEIYNWKELEAKAQNDTEALLSLLETQTVEDTLKRLDGIYAFCYWKDKTVVLARDVLGVKPLFYYFHNNVFAFASERKTLEAFFEQKYINEVHPRQILTYDMHTVAITERKFFELPEQTTKNEAQIIKQIEVLMEQAIQKRIPQKEFGLLFSGGIDSVYIAHVLKKHGYTIPCYTAALAGENEAEDLTIAKKAAVALDLDVRVCTITLTDVPDYLQKIIPLIESSNVIKVGVALPFFLCCEQAKKDGIKVLFSGLGSEEIFAGYDRHDRALDINKECISGLRKIYERDLYRDDVITMHHTIELRLPFLDKQLVEFALTIPNELKIKDNVKKYILRETAAYIGIPTEFAQRPKKAAQYGSKFDKAIQKLAKQHGFKLKSQYLNTFYPPQNQRLGVLFSSGKDSTYALYTMQQQNYPIVCLITIKSKNKDSYMFHTPAVELAELQAKALDLPIVVQETQGEEESELEDLKIAVKHAKEKFGLDGIVTGALYSTYQRERIEKIVEELGLLVFSPLWHIDQETEMRDLLKKGFEIVFTKVAAQGLDKSWLGRTITQSDVDSLVELHKQIGLHIAGEGGEFESFVIDGPNFMKKIEIKKRQIEEIDKYTATLSILEATAVDKES